MKPKPKNPSKEVELLTKEFLAKDIKVGDWVHLKGWNVFAKIYSIHPRWDHKSSNRCAENLPFNPRTMHLVSPLVRLEDIVRMTRGVDFSLLSQLDAAHCTKVTREYLNAYIGDLVTETVSKLSAIKL